MSKKKLIENMVRRILREEIDPKATASANALLLMDRLRNNPQFMKMIQEIQLPTDKYKAILHFANLLGIPEERFEDFMRNVKIQTNESRLTEYSDDIWSFDEIDEFLDISGIADSPINRSNYSTGGFVSGDYGRVKVQIISSNTKLLLSFQNEQEMKSFWNRASHQLINPYDFHRHQGLNDNQLIVTFYNE